MKPKLLLLTVLVSVAGPTWLSSPAGAECWMVCPPESTASPNETGIATATTEPTSSAEELTRVEKPEATAKAAPAPAPAKLEAATAPAGAGPAPKPTQVQSTTQPPPSQDAVTQPPPTPATLWAGRSIPIGPHFGSVTSPCSNPGPGA
jgi:hypothetical protein